MRKLNELEIGEIGIIMALETNDMKLKLMELGCLPGETIRIEQIGIKGDPISVQISGYNLSLRLTEAQSIVIK